ncbi:MAG TPA: hypothetical protein VGO58_00585 [Chitinophagaceae bacterium]|jgi:hypothetical protein|nr:hypothetical protein [Chitinophagaceae bacterium]
MSFVLGLFKIGSVSLISKGMPPCQKTLQRNVKAKYFLLQLVAELCRSQRQQGFPGSGILILTGTKKKI